ncbi:MAG: tRNA (adenosine(37)-N6)-dimethylallyltransferase MiaA [Christensenellales bacterium]|jgi:tRNA dimethylallyltransferase
MAMKQPLICVVGTNASGKSALGVELARAFNGEIISADSRQVFRGLDLGSGKITTDEMRGVAHHLIDIRDPNEFFSMADFQTLAYNAIDSIHARGRLPFLVGGTGLYVSSVAEGYELSGGAPDLQYRAQLEHYDTPTLHRMLIERMPGAEVDPRNRNRVMRLLERLKSGDDLSPRRAPHYDCLKIGVTWERAALCRRIDERLQARMDAGMLDEVRLLLHRGATPEFLTKLGLEYRYLYQYLAGDFATEVEMLDELARAIKRFAKRQMTWFRKDASILWLDMRADPIAQARAAVGAWLEGRKG